ncbi:helix-turn-helix domain-containing protein [Paenibacillus kyungheensis]
MNLPKIVGLKIKEIRKSKGWTQEQLAETASIHYSYIGGIERGERNISLETLQKIIDALEVSAVELFPANTTILKNEVLKEHIEMISERSIQDIELIHRVSKDILNALDETK